MKLQQWKNLVGTRLPSLGLALFALVLAACGSPAKFQKQEFKATAVAGQYIRPKIDILIVQDNSSSMAVPINNIKGQLNGFLDGIDSRWDYHFTVLPLQSQMPITSKWVIAQDCNSIDSSHRSYCLSNGQKSTFNSAGSGTTHAWINTINASTGNTDLGFQNIQSNLSHSSMTSTGFLRSDAALAVIVVSNGEDVTGVSYHDPDGDGTPSIDYTASQASATAFQNYLSGLKGGLSQVKFYSVVAANNYASCHGDSSTRQGLRYMNLANAVNGYQGFYDLCDGNGLSSVLGNIKYQLDAMVDAYRFNYAVLDAEPVPSSIVVKKNGVTIPQSSTNGWEYVGYRANQAISYFPTLSNLRSGYMIKLNGTAEYKGSDLIDISFQRR